MSSPLYYAKFVEKDGAMVRLELSIIHPDVSEFGTDRFFAWKLLSDWVSPAHDDDDLTMASKHIKRVSISALSNANVDEQHPTFFRVKRVEAKNPTLTYTIEVNDPSLLGPIDVGDGDEVYHYVEPDKVVPESAGAMSVPNADAGGARRLEFMDGSSAKFWDIRRVGSELHIKWGKLGTTGQSQVKTFATEEKAMAEHDKLLAEKLKKGYANAAGSAAAPTSVTKEAPAESKSAATPSKPRATAATSKAPAKSTKKSDASPPPPRSYDDFRTVTFELIAKNPSLSDRLGVLIQQWSATMNEDDLARWIDRVVESEGWRCQTAALVASRFARAGRIDAAKRFLATAERLFQPDDRYARHQAQQGLIPAWWLLGRTSDADREFAALAEQMKADYVDANQANHMLWSLAAIGRQTDEVNKRLASWLVQSDYRADLLVPGIVALIEDGQNASFEPLLARWSELRSDGDSALSLEVLRQFDTAGTPEQYVSLASKYAVLARDQFACVSIAATERLSASRAVEAAKSVLARGDHFHPMTSMFAVAVLAAHAPADASAWAANATVLSDGSRRDRPAYLAALGRHDEVRAEIARIGQSVDPYAMRDFAAVSWLTDDRQIAIDSIEALLANPGYDTRSADALWLRLVDLGRREAVDAYLQKAAADVEALPPKDRDLRCRAIARTAGLTGRVDLGLKVAALPTKAMRRYSAKELVTSCATVGDWGGALSALDLDPDDGPNGRASAALHSGMVKWEDARYDGPRSLPPRALLRG